MPNLPTIAAPLRSRARPSRPLRDAAADVLRNEEAAAVLTVTHNPGVAQRASKRLTMRDGVVTDGD